MKPRRGKRRTKRAGYALVLFVMMFFGMMGLAALVIDMGFARLAQRQMQTAVDSAALEGLRWRDSPTTNARQQASQITASLFTDYVDSSGGTVTYGAGPVVNFSGVGPPELAASQLMQPGSPPVYQPGALQLNSGNATQGDIVAGTYGSNPAYDQQSPVPSADEDDNYNRRDFQNTSNQAFLVRMRRTVNSGNPGYNTSNNTSGLDLEDGISSSGPTLPVLFGRGSMMARTAGVGTLTAASGITVRATAIAAAGTVTGLSQNPYQAGRAKAAGPPYQGTDANNNPVNIPGTTPFSITANAWNSMPANLPQAFQSSGGSGDVQWFGATPTNVIQIGQLVSVMGGTATTLAASNGTASTATNNGYVPIYNTYYDEFNIGYNIIIGFGYVGWDGGGTTLSLTKLGSAPVGWGNVSAVLVGAMQLPVDASGNPVVSVSTLFSDHVNLVTNPLYAPVLVNHYIGPGQ